VPRAKPLPETGHARAGSPRNRLWPKMSLAAFLAGTSGMLVGIAILSVLLLTVAANFRNTYTLLNDKAVLVMETLVERITDRVANVEPSVSALTRLYASGAFGFERTDKRTALLEGMLLADQAVRAIVIYSRDFNAEGVYRDAEGNVEFTTRAEAVSPQIEEALRALRLGDPPRWGPPVYVAGATFMNVAAPLSRDGHLDGYVVAAVGIDGFSAIVEDVGRKFSSAVALLYGDDTVFAHTTLSGQLVPLDAKEQSPTMPFDRLSDPILSQFANRKPLDGFQRARQAGVSVSTITTAEGPFVVLTRQIEGYGPKPWNAVLFQPDYEVMDEIHRLRGSFLIGLVLLALSVVVAIFTGRSIARAVGRIAPEAERIARFEFEQVGRLPESRIFEVDTEARAFNSMVEGLRTFSLYVPRQLVHRLLLRGFDEATRSRSQEATVLFTDIVGFTALSEHMTAEQASCVLNAHFAGLVACVEEEFGMIDKFMGDGMMAFWAEHDVPDHADRAVRAALAIKRHAEACAAQSRQSGEPALRIRIGVHSGSVIVGNLGAPDRVNYTIVGDTVNVASRLESFGRNIDASADAIVLASEETVARLSFPVVREPVGAVHLTGREALVEIWRLVGIEMPRGLVAPTDPGTE
jgi:adenylate cyclase